MDERSSVTRMACGRQLFKAMARPCRRAILNVALAETLRRAALYLEAGASGIFTPGPADEAVIGALADGIKAPLNIMLRPTTPPAPRLAALGVRRLSSATAPFRATYGALVEALPAYLETGTFGSFAGRGALPGLDAVFRRA